MSTGESKDLYGQLREPAKQKMQQLILGISQDAQGIRYNFFVSSGQFVFWDNVKQNN